MGRTATEVKNISVLILSKVEVTLLYEPLIKDYGALAQKAETSEAGLIWVLST
jgi:hypothetical protein